MKLVKPVNNDEKSRLRQIYEQLYVTFKYQITPSQYYLYRFYKKDKDYNKMKEYMSRWAYFTYFQPTLNNPNWAPLIKNKWFFHAHYSNFEGIPLTNVFGFFHRDSGFVKGGGPLSTAEDLINLLRTKRPSAVVFKPANGFQGKGVLIIDKVTYEENILFYTNKGETLDIDGLMEYLNGEPAHEVIDEGFLIEEKLVQHPFFEEINPAHANTMRIITFVKANNEVDVHYAMLRLGRKGSPTDNWQWGNIAVEIEPATGVMGRGLHSPGYHREYVSKHPDTGVTFTGRKIPMWDEIVKAAKTIALATPNSRAVGWDIGLSVDGPVIIEGNKAYDMAWPQAYDSGYLRPEIVEQMKEYGLDLTPGFKAKFLLDLVRRK